MKQPLSLALGWTKTNRLCFEGILWGPRGGVRCKDLPASYLLAQHLLAPSAHLRRTTGLADGMVRLSGAT